MKVKREKIKTIVVMTAGLVLVSCSSLPTLNKGGTFETGMASWYGRKFQGHKTASGERYDMNQLTAAHRTLAFGTLVQVKSLTSGRSVVVRINDRGPFSEGRIIDVSYEAAVQLDLVKKGEDRVELEIEKSPPILSSAQAENIVE